MAERNIKQAVRGKISVLEEGRGKKNRLRGKKNMQPVESTQLGCKT